MSFRSNQDFILALVAIVAIVLLELVALSKGVNGVGLTTSVAGICGAAGFSIGRYVQKVKAEIKAVQEIKSEMVGADHAR